MNKYLIKIANSNIRRLRQIQDIAMATSMVKNKKKKDKKNNKEQA